MNSLTISLMFDILMLLKGWKKWGETDRRGKWIKNMNINRTSIRMTSPKTIHANVKSSSSSFLSIWGRKMDLIRIINGLQFRFWKHTPVKRVGVMSPISFWQREGKLLALWTREYMIHREGSPTYTESC